MQAGALAHAVDEAPDGHLALGVLAPDRLHVTAPGLGHVLEGAGLPQGIGLPGRLRRSYSVTKYRM